MSHETLANENTILRHDLEVCEAWIDAIEAANARFLQRQKALQELLGSLHLSLVGMAHCSACRACQATARHWAETLQTWLLEEERRDRDAEAQSASAQTPKAMATAHHPARA
ncbi:MAG TPA: hypothetical protein VNP04_21580 [Alphaproteobacteria bacterium]|nr:hypothetical protein [Alphaproteobacteria bacterium]